MSKKKENFKLDTPATPAQPKQKKIEDYPSPELGLLLDEVNGRIALLNQDRLSIRAELEKRKTL